MKKMSNEAVLLYSGGTDSTLAACLLLEKFERVHLLTFTRKGIFNPQNSKFNVKKLSDRYGDRVIHKIIDISRIFSLISYDDYVKSIIKYGFLNLSTCGLCKLAMHIRAALYCVDNKIFNIADGANNGMYLFPDQQEGYIKLLKKYYSDINIVYENPVYDYISPPDIDFVDRFRLDDIPGLKNKDLDIAEIKKKTTGYRLYQMGIMPLDNVKGSEIDRKMQPRCFQFVLFNIWLFWYYLPFNGIDKYKKDVVDFYDYKFKNSFDMIKEYSVKKDGSRIYKYI